MVRSAIGVAAAAALFLSPVTGAGAKDKPLSAEETILKWRDGPVRYLMTTREDESVRQIKSVPELARFITRFWARRDPTPGTFENEYRRTYWGRVIEANQKFRDSTVPGWKTDRGKVYVLLGAPDDTQTDESPRVPSSIGGVTRDQVYDTDRRGLERWTYRRRLSKASRSEFVVAFVRDESLAWKLTTDPDLLQPSFPGSSTGDPKDPAFGGIEGGAVGVVSSATPASNAFGGEGAVSASSPDTSAAARLAQSAVETAQLLPALDTSLLANYDLGLEMAVPSNTQAVIATVTAREFLSAFSASPRFEYFRAQDGATFVNVGGMVRVPDLYGEMKTGVSTLRVYGSITPASDPTQPRYASNESQPVRFDLRNGAPPGGLIEVWTGLALPAGRYHALLAVEDSLTGRLGRTAADFEVPDYSAPGLSLSTLILASELSDSGGRLGVTARSSSTFSRSESFGTYFEVYGLENPTRPFGVSYSFYHEEDGIARPIGKPVVFSDRTGAAQGWSFPLSKWPAGRYRIEITVDDPAGPSVSVLAPFEVID